MKRDKEQKSFASHYKDGRIICHNCNYRIKNSSYDDVCKIDHRRVKYTTPCRHGFKNPTREELKQKVEEMDKKLKKWCEENPDPDYSHIWSDLYAY